MQQRLFYMSVVLTHPTLVICTLFATHTVCLYHKSIMNKEKITKLFAGKKIALLWFWKEWHSSYEFLHSVAHIPDEQITIHDEQRPDSVPKNIKLQLGAACREGLTSYDLIIRTAGISPYRQELEHVQHKLTTQMEIFFDLFPGKIIGITWTKGKSTTTDLIFSLLQKADISSTILGNVWIAPLDLFLTKKPLPDRAVIEISSYQADGLRGSVEIAVLTSLYHEHHASRHHSETNYFAAKRNLIAQAKTVFLGAPVIHTHPELVATLWPKLPVVYWSSWTYSFHDETYFKNDQPIANNVPFSLLWDHNRQNASVLFGIADLLHIPYTTVTDTLTTYQGLPHRCEDIGIHAGKRRIDDAISTTPESTCVAIQALLPDLETIFLGGKDWGYEFTALIALLVQSNIKNIILFPDSGKIIEKLLPPGRFLTYHTTDMTDAVHRANKHTPVGKTVLLSCASPSYSVWKNFEQKGDLFQQAILTL